MNIDTELSHPAWVCGLKQKETFRRSNNLDIKGIWTHGNSIVLAWLPIPSFDDILKNNNKK